MGERLPADAFAPQIERLRGAPGPVVDLACGRGRTALAGARAGLRMIGIDRNASFLRELAARAREHGLRVGLARCDLESGHGLPLRAGRCGAIVVFRYLHRPLLRALVDALAPGGWLVYETFTLAQRDLGWGPRNPDFLLAPGELAQRFGAFSDVEICEHAAGLTDADPPAAVERLVARRR